MARCFAVELRSFLICTIQSNAHTASPAHSVALTVWSALHLLRCPAGARFALRGGPLHAIIHARRMRRDPETIRSHFNLARARHQLELPPARAAAYAAKLCHRIPPPLRLARGALPPRLALLLPQRPQRRRSRPMSLQLGGNASDLPPSRPLPLSQAPARNSKRPI